MQPILFSAGSVQIPAYGLCLAVLSTLAWLVVPRLLGRAGVSAEEALSVLSIGAGSVLLWAALQVGLGRMGMVDTPHLSAMPIMGLGALSLLVYLKARGHRVDRLFDIIAPFGIMALGIQYGFGSFMAGSSFGAPTALPWGVTFPPGSPAHAAFGPTPVHPTQLYLGIGFLALGVLGTLYRRGSGRDGNAALFCFTGASVLYLAVSPFRGDHQPMLETPFLASGQATALAVLCASLSFSVRRNGPWTASHA